VVQETYLDDILDEEYDALPLAQLGDDSRAIELDVHDPELFRSEPAYDDVGLGPSPGVQLDPDRRPPR
jgi:hypothetical protein